MELLTRWPRAEVAPRPTAEAALMYDSALDLNKNQGILDSFSLKMVPASPLEEINNHTLWISMFPKNWKWFFHISERSKVGSNEIPPFYRWGKLSKVTYPRSEAEQASCDPCFSSHQVTPPLQVKILTFRFLRRINSPFSNLVKI